MTEKKENIRSPIFFMNKPLQKYNFLKIFAWIHLCIWGIFGLLPDFWANDLPLKTTFRNKTYYPLFQPALKDSFPDLRTGKSLKLLSLSEVNWHSLESTANVLTLAGYSPKTGGSTTRLQSPFGPQFYTASNGYKKNLAFSKRHYLGTDDNDYDVFSGLIHGAAYSFGIATGTLLLILTLGMTVGGSAAYFGNDKLTFSTGELISILAGLIPAVFYGFYIRKWGFPESFFFSGTLGYILSWTASVILAVFILFLFYNVGKILNFIPFFRKKTPFPLERILQFILDAQTSIPVILMVITLTAILPKTVSATVVTIGLAAYTGFARIIRSELSVILRLPYTEAAYNLGLTPLRILLRHTFPNIAPLLYSISLYTISDIILFEASLSFLGIGINPENHTSWGAMLAQARNYPQAWWLTLFPALLIFLTIFSLHYLAGNKSRMNKSEKTFT